MKKCVTTRSYAFSGGTNITGGNLNNPSLPYFLQGVKGLPTQLIWGREDRVVPVSAATAYQKALANTEVRLAVYDNCGHRPEIEQRDQFLKTVREFLA